MSGHCLCAAMVRSPCRACLFALLAVAMIVTTAAAEPWQGRLQGGAEVTIDAQTRRAMSRIDGHQRPLWDGVHRLEDGSTVIVRDGIAVPTAPMYERWESEPKPEPVFEYRYCEQLVRKTCGFDDACSSSSACLRARTLLGKEMEEQRQVDRYLIDLPQTATSELCVQALVDPSFPACASLAAEAGNSRCRALVERVCGAAGACADSQACDAARQLQALETDERLVNADPSALSITGGQCLEAMTNPFFEPCGVDQGDGP
jgi:hypothetical protein